MESQRRYYDALERFDDVKYRCMIGNGWKRETEEDYNKRKQSESEVSQKEVLMGQSK